MRLIDADALYGKARDLEAQALTYIGENGNNEKTLEDLRIWSAVLAERTAFKHDVFDAPTIEPEPSQVARDIATIIENEKDMRVIGERKKGRKINQHQYPAKWICSECGAKHFNFDDNFCSNCGADVRKRAKC